MQISRSTLVALGVLSARAALAQAELYKFDGPSAGDEHGFSVAGIGDVNTDGRPDFAVGAYKHGAAGFEAGAVFAYSGADGALLWTAHGDAAGDWFGHSVASAGDANGDGIPDVVAGARLASPLGITGAGIAKLLDGASGATLVVRRGDSPLDNLGFAVGGGVDVNADGHSDFLAGAPFDDNTGTDAGLVRVYSGNPATLGAILYEIDGDSAGDLFGWSVAGAGDLDHDGFGDFVVGAPWDDHVGTNSGRARAFSGRTGGSPLIWTWNGAAAGDEFGSAVAGAGDADGDGFDDLVIGAHNDMAGGPLSAGSARVVSGRTGATLWTVYGAPGWYEFGTAVAGLGDVDGDGKSDVAVGATYETATGRGVVRVFSGASGATLYTVRARSLDGDDFGISVSACGDLNGDGKADLFVGAREGADTPSYAGSAHAILSGWAATTKYCTAKVNSLGCTPSIEASGAASLSVGDDLLVTASNVLNHKSGLFFWGLAPAAAPFGGGLRCVHAPVQRTAVQDSGGSAPPAVYCDGSYSFHFSQAYMLSKGLAVGTSIYGQYWSRDPGFAPPNSVGLTDGISFQVCP